MAHVILYIATSQDGFIADKEGSVDWLPQQSNEEENARFNDFLDSIDVIAQGSRTYLQSLTFIEKGIVPDLPYKGKIMYVFTKKPMQTDRSDVIFVSSIEEFLHILDQNPHIHRVWLLGGAELIASFHKYDLIDECIITIILKDIYEGIALPPQIFDTMREVESKHYSQEIIEKRYLRKEKH